MDIIQVGDSTELNNLNVSLCRDGVPFHIQRHNMKVRFHSGDIWKQPQSQVFPDKIELYILSPILNTSDKF